MRNKNKKRKGNKALNREQIFVMMVIASLILGFAFMLGDGITGFATYEAMGSSKLWNNTFDTTGKNISGIWNVEANATADWFYPDSIGYRTFDLNTKPHKVVLYSPTNGNNSIIDRYTNFSWYNATDDENDALRYQILVDDNNSFDNPVINISNIAEGDNLTNYISAVELDLSKTYYWKVRAYETGTNLYGEFSDVWNFSIVSFKAINVVVDNVDFGNMDPGEQNDTIDNKPGPILVENTGNIPVNLTINGTGIWDSIAAPNDNYRYLIGVNESGSFNESASVTTWTQMPITAPVNPQVIDLEYHENDTAEIELNVTVPNDEAPGGKQSEVFIVS